MRAIKIKKFYCTDCGKRQIDPKVSDYCEQCTRRHERMSNMIKKVALVEKG